MDSENTKKITIGGIFKCIIYCICITIIGCVIIRSCAARNVELVERVIYNEETLEAYGDAPFVVREYPLMDFWRSVNGNHLLQIDHLYYAPPAKQLQVSVKYRTSYAHAPDGQDIPFEFYLEDELGNRFDNYFYETDSRGQYGFIRVCFEDVELRPTDDPQGGKLYRFYIDVENETGAFAPLESFELYDGSNLYEEVPVEIKENKAQ